MKPDPDDDISDLLDQIPDEVVMQNSKFEAVIKPDPDMKSEPISTSEISPRLIPSSVIKPDPDTEPPMPRVLKRSSDFDQEKDKPPTKRPLFTGIGFNKRIEL